MGSIYEFDIYKWSKNIIENLPEACSAFECTKYDVKYRYLGTLIRGSFHYSYWMHEHYTTCLLRFLQLPFMNLKFLVFARGSFPLRTHQLIEPKLNLLMNLLDLFSVEIANNISTVTLSKNTWGFHSELISIKWYWRRQYPKSYSIYSKTATKNVFLSQVCITAFGPLLTCMAIAFHWASL